MKNSGILEMFKKYASILLLSLILLVQVVSLGYTGTQKVGLHIDEHYSYILSNSYDADRISNADEVWNKWLDGDSFREFLTVEKGEQFAYHKVYENNGKDAHPPLFYFLLHTFCSLLPGVWSPWIGMVMNIALIVLAQVVLYKLSRELMGDSLWAIIPPAIYGGMQVFVDTALFIRMYPLMTLLTVLLVWQHYHLAVEENKYKSILWCGILTFLGTFTQYYFAFIAFFLAAATCVFLLIRKNWKPLFAYAAAMLFGVILVFIVFPAGISQIMGSETNNIGKEVAGNILDFSGWGSAIFSMANQMIIGMFIGIRRCLPFTAVLMVITAIALIILKFTRKQTNEPNQNFKKVLILGTVLAATVGFTIIIISHVTGKFVYVRYLYNLFPLIALLLSIVIWLFAEKLKLNKKVLICGVIAVCLISTVTVARNDMCTYLFTQRTQNDNTIIEQCKDKPLVVLNNGSTYQPTALLHIFLASDEIYMANYNDMESMDTVLEQVDCSNGVVYLVLTDTEWSDGFDGDILMTEIIDESKTLENYESFGICSFTTVYIAYPKIELADKFSSSNKI